MARRTTCRSVLLFLLLVIGSPPQGHGQALYTVKQCTELIKRGTYALQNDQNQLLVDVGREYLSYCKGIDPGMEPYILEDIGTGLIGLKHYDDAVPVLRQCLTLAADSAGCWLQLGDATFFLGKIQEAKQYYEKVVEIGGTTEHNAVAVGVAKRRLAMIHEMPAPAHASGPNPDSTPEAQHTFGTGFFVTPAGHLSTNNHVVANCKTITTETVSRSK